jgi:hypothetical protein
LLCLSVASWKNTSYLQVVEALLFLSVASWKSTSYLQIIEAILTFSLFSFFFFFFPSVMGFESEPWAIPPALFVLVVLR